MLVEDTSGRIRRGDVLLFYPADENLTKLPDSSFTNFFIFESMKTDGTFSLISLSDVTQYEMDFTNGSPGNSGFGRAEHQYMHRLLINRFVKTGFS